MVIVILLLAAYLAGSIPFGYIFVHARTGLDIHKYGSHSAGAINVIRVGGVWLGLATLLADAGKAFGIVLLSSILMFSPWVVALAAFLCMAGHAYSLWLLLLDRRFSEGKSVASALGVLLGLAFTGNMSWCFALMPLEAWIIGLLGPRLLTGRWYCISPATMVASSFIPLAMYLAHPEPAYVLLSFGMTVLILLRHKNNIKRLLDGTEPRLGVLVK